MKYDTDTAAKERATEMVDNILATIERAGRIEGRKGEKRIVFSSVLSTKSGEPEPLQIYDRLVNYVARNLKEFPHGK